MMLCFSQTTYPHILNDSLIIITNRQLKVANLVFLENSKLKDINLELELKVSDYQALYETELKLDSVYYAAVVNYENELDSSKKQIEQQQYTIKTIAKKLKLWRISGCGVALIFVAVCLL